MAGYSREFLSIEQALKQVVKDLKSDGVLKSTGKTESYFRKCSDENDADRLIHHIDSVKLDIECMKRGLGHPLLTAHQIQIEKAMGDGQKRVLKSEIPIAKKLRVHLKWEASE